MKNVIFFDDNEVRRNLLPLTYTRPVALLRVGIDTIADKWRAALGADKNYSFLTATYLKAKFPAVVRRENLMVAGHILPDERLVAQVNALASGEALMLGEELVAFRGTAHAFDARHYKRVVFCERPPLAVHYPFHIFELNGQVLERDFARLTAGRVSQPLSGTNTVVGDASRIFVEEGAVVEGAFLNTREGSIYVGRDAEIMEGAAVRGALAMCPHSKVRMGAKVYGATTLGPHCKVGGEVENVVMIGYSNKAHEGFLGDAVVGEWCNIGGGTTASNLKNDYGEIKLWNYTAKRFLRTGRQFCGPIIGDHCKIGINSMINTATVLGVGVNIHGGGLPRNFVASFMEGNSSSGFRNQQLEAFLATAQRVMSRRGIALSDVDRDIFTAIYNISDRYK